MSAFLHACLHATKHPLTHQLQQSWNDPPLCLMRLSCLHSSQVDHARNRFRERTTVSQGLAIDCTQRSLLEASSLPDWFIAGWTACHGVKARVGRSRHNSERRRCVTSIGSAERLASTQVASIKLPSTHQFLAAHDLQQFGCALQAVCWKVGDKFFEMLQLWQPSPQRPSTSPTSGLAEASPACVLSIWLACS